MLHTDAEEFARYARKMMLEGDTRMWSLMLERSVPKLPTEISGPDGGPITMASLARQARQDEGED